MPPNALEQAQLAGERLGLAGLIARMAAGDEAALAEFHRLMADRLFSMALRMLGDRGAAADALQDCLVRVWRQAGRYDRERSDAFTWVSMVLRGLCLDQLRSRGRRAVRIDRWRDENRDDISGAARGLEDLFFRETVGQVRQALAELSESERDCLETALFSPDTVSEAAARLGVAPGTLKVRIHRAMRRLRDLLDSKYLTKP